MTEVRKLIKAWKKDAEFQEKYEALEGEFTRARQLIAARTRAGLTQAQVAKKMKTTQPVVARLESGKRMPSYQTLQKYAQAVGCEVRLELVPIEGP